MINYRDKYNQYVGARDSLNKRYESTVKTLDANTIDYNDALVASALLQKAAINTQEKLKYSIEEIVTSAVYSVFGEKGYDFSITFEKKNNRTFCSLKFIDSTGEKFDAEDDLGGSIADIASFACRVALWTLMGEGKTASVFLLDECMKHLSEEWRGGGSELLKAFCDKLGMQVIVSTHLNELQADADTAIKVWKDDNEISHVKGSAT